MAEQYTALVKLSGTDLKLAVPAEDIRGRKVIDCNGEVAGHVDELIIDDLHKQVRFIRIASGGVLGIGGQKILIPVELIKRVEKDVVHIDRACEHLSNAPVYDPQVTLDDQRAAALYGYFGVAPFWSGYGYPGWGYHV